MFKKILIANRGEIACRIMRTAREFGVKTVAVYSEADRQAPHVALADEAVHIGNAPAAESYLKIENIIEAAKRTGAEAIHPGYGFLSENAAFALACKKAGLVFIGPTPMAIQAMGDKAAAKARMEKAGVPTLPGYHGSDMSAATLKKEAKRVGYPVLLKAVAGGGGKGMRLVEKEADLADALAAVQREAKSSFGDERVLVEKYLTSPRHVEIQVFADTQGHTVYLYERDCSLQRRHQKVVEEAPAPGLPPEVRTAMGLAAVKAAKAIGYVGAGTVEFLLDSKNNFYFMEMNTRLQVEHPVTEMVTDTDLVAWQLHVASGEALPVDTQENMDEVYPNGHAVEVRVYAEDPSKNFLPATGKLALCRFPENMPNVRVDTGVVEGGEITPYYDPMIAKIIAWGPTRVEAITTLGLALAETHIAGVVTNIDYLRAILAHPDFIAGKVETGFLARHADKLVQKAAVPELAPVMAVLNELNKRFTAAQENRTSHGDAYSPWHVPNGWRIGGYHTENMTFQHEGKDIAVPTTYLGNDMARIGKHMVSHAHYNPTDRKLYATIDGYSLSARVAEAEGHAHVFMDGQHTVLTRHMPLDDVAGGEDVLGRLTAPIPGVVVKVTVKAGAKLKKGADIMILEAMKTEHRITAPADGTVDAVHFKEGDHVEKDAVLAAFTALEGKAVARK